MMQVQKYLKEKGVESLCEELYINVKKVDNLLVLNYNQIESPKTDPIVIECRSLILDTDFNVVSRSFDRFFNLGEALDVSPEIDWNKASCFEKVDGSLIKIYNHKGVWYIATRGTAYADSGVNGFDITFKEIVLKSLSVDEEDFQAICGSNLDREWTYIFEVTSVENRVVKRYEGYTLHYLAARHNQTGEYGDDYEKQAALRIGAVEVKEYKFSNVEECLETIKNLKDLDEGYVVYQDGKPISKIKSPAYIAVHLIRGEGLSPKRIMQLVLINEQAEYFVYFPEDEKFFTPYEDALKTLVSQMVECYDSVKGIEDQKEFALAVKDKPFSAVLFQARKDGSDVVHKFHQQSESYKMKVLEGYV